MISAPVYAADAIYAEPVPAAPIISSAYDWNGAYVGGHIGGAWGDADFNFVSLGTASTSSVDGVFGGGQIGFNFQCGNWVLGAEADMSASGIDGSGACPNPLFNCNVDVNWLATVRGRVGYAMNNIMIYGTGGFSAADVEYNATVAATGLPFGTTDSDTATGWNVGGGVEWGFAERWSVKTEYLYYSFGDTDLSAAAFGSAPTNVDLDLHTVKAGLNFRF